MYGFRQHRKGKRISRKNKYTRQRNLKTKDITRERKKTCWQIQKKTTACSIPPHGNPEGCVEETFPVSAMILFSIFQSKVFHYISNFNVSPPQLKLKRNSSYRETVCLYHPVTVYHPITSVTTPSHGYFVKGSCKGNYMLQKWILNDVLVVCTKQCNVTLFTFEMSLWYFKIINQRIKKWIKIQTFNLWFLKKGTFYY